MTLCLDQVSEQDPANYRAPNRRFKWSSPLGGLQKNLGPWSSESGTGLFFSLLFFGKNDWKEVDYVTELKS